MKEDREWWKNTPTDELLHQIAKQKIIINRMIALELARRRETAAQLPRNFRRLNRTAEGWFAMHVPYLLALVPENENFFALLEILRKESNLIGGRVDTDLHSAFLAFGPAYRGELAWLVENRESPDNVRFASYKALVCMISDENDCQLIYDLSRRLAADDPLISHILPFLSVAGRDGFTTALEIAKTAGKSEMELAGIQATARNGVRISVRKPWDWFDPENLFYIHMTHFGIPSIKGSDMCLCGSRKKFRDCCIGAWHRAKNRTEEYGLLQILLRPP